MKKIRFSNLAVLAERLTRGSGINLNRPANLMKDGITSKAALPIAIIPIAMFGLGRASRSDQWGRIVTTNLKTRTNPDGSYTCPSSGGDCTEDNPVYIYEYMKQAGSGGSTSYLIAGTLDSVSANIPGDTESLNPAGFTFPPGSSITIDSANFPGVGPTQAFDLSGITTDSLGNFTATVTNPD